MIVYYHKCRYTVPYSVGFIILQDEIWLIFRRLLRCVKRYLSYGKNLIVPLVVTIIAISLIFYLGRLTEKYSNLFDVFWDLKTFLLSTFIITYSTTSLTNETHRHMALKAQYLKNYKYELEIAECVRALCKMIDIPAKHRIFLTELHADIIRKALNERVHDDTKQVKSLRTQKLTIQLIMKDVDAAVSVVSSYFSNTTLVNTCDIEELSDSLLNIQKFVREELIKIQADTDITVGYIANLALSLINVSYHSIAILRRPWRAQKDYQLNNKIRELLTTNGKMVSGSFDSTLYWMCE